MKRCTERSDFVDRKQRIKPQRTQRGEAATEFRIISRKDAKAAKRKKYLSELSVPGALAGGISESEMFRILENLPEPRNFSSIVVYVTNVLPRAALIPTPVGKHRSGCKDRLWKRFRFSAAA